MMNSREESRSGSRDRDGSGSDDELGSESEDSSNSITVLVHVFAQLRHCCFKDMAGIFYEDFCQDYNGWHTRTIFEVSQILTFSFDSVLILRNTIARYRLDLLAAPLGKYSPVLVRGFYASYAATVIEATLKKAKPIMQPRLT